MYPAPADIAPATAPARIAHPIPVAQTAATAIVATIPAAAVATNFHGSSLIACTVCLTVLTVCFAHRTVVSLTTFTALAALFTTVFAADSPRQRPSSQPSSQRS